MKSVYMDQSKAVTPDLFIVFFFYNVLGVVFKKKYKTYFTQNLDIQLRNRCKCLSKISSLYKINMSYSRLHPFLVWTWKSTIAISTQPYVDLQASNTHSAPILTETNMLFCVVLNSESHFGNISTDL